MSDVPRSRYDLFILLKPPLNGRRYEQNYPVDGQEKELLQGSNDQPRRKGKSKSDHKTR